MDLGLNISRSRDIEHTSLNERDWMVTRRASVPLPQCLVLIMKRKTSGKVQRGIHAKQH
jgi:hypothetical protein